MKTAKRILTVALALMLIFAMAAPSFALLTTGYIPVENGNSYYVQGADSLYEMDGEFTVYLSISGGKRASAGPINRIYEVTMGTPNAIDQKYTVYDVFTAAQAQHSNLYLNTSTPNQYHQSWLQGVKDTSVAYSTWFEAEALKLNGTTYYCGWMFRINGMLPYYTHTVNNNSVTEACLITDAYVTAGDTIDLYYSNVYTQAVATKVRAVVYMGTSGNTSSFKLLEAQCYVPSGQTNWTLTSWSPVANANSIKVKIDGSSKTISTDSYGVFTRTNLSTGSHSIQFKTTTEAYSFVENNITYTYEVPYIVGMYSEFTV